MRCLPGLFVGIKHGERVVAYDGHGNGSRWLWCGCFVVVCEGVGLYLWVAVVVPWLDGVGDGVVV
eukprot:6512269-Alexandrium_andersonii.AAC.1